MHAVSCSQLFGKRERRYRHEQPLPLHDGIARLDCPSHHLEKQPFTAASLVNVLYTIIRSALGCTQHEAKRLFHFFSASLFADYCCLLPLIMMAPGSVTVFLEMHYEYRFPSRCALDQMQRRARSHGVHLPGHGGYYSRAQKVLGHFEFSTHISMIYLI